MDWKRMDCMFVFVFCFLFLFYSFLLYFTFILFYFVMFYFYFFCMTQGTENFVWSYHFWSYVFFITKLYITWIYHNSLFLLYVTKNFSLIPWYNVNGKNDKPKCHTNLLNYHIFLLIPRKKKCTRELAMLFKLKTHLLSLGNIRAFKNYPTQPQQSCTTTEVWTFLQNFPTNVHRKDWEFGRVDTQIYSASSCDKQNQKLKNFAIFKFNSHHLVQSFCQHIYWKMLLIFTDFQ